MQPITNTKLIGGFLLIACIMQACHTATVSKTPPTPLMCYVCENCAKVTKQTALEACDAEFFDNLSTTMEPTTDATTTTTTTAPTTTTTTLATTTETIEDSTSTESSSTKTTTVSSTTEAAPTAPTVGPALSTTVMPTPPDADIALIPVDNVVLNNATADNTTIATTTVEPQAQPLIAEDYTYHCFSVEKNVNGTLSIDRGCSRVTTMESVCGQLNAMNNGIPLSKCVGCSNSQCNSSAALGVSAAALLFALVATLLSRK